MKSQIVLPASIMVLGLAALAFAPLALGQCGGGSCSGHSRGTAAAPASPGGTGHQHGGTADGAARAHASTALAEPAKSVFGRYLQIQKALASDSLAGVAENAAVIAGDVRGDTMKMLPAAVAQQADALARAKDLAAAREAFKPLSRSLVGYVTTYKLTGQFVVVHCSMAKGSWLQADRSVANPYYGASMLTCGEIVQ